MDCKGINSKELRKWPRLWHWARTNEHELSCVSGTIYVNGNYSCM